MIRKYVHRSDRTQKELDFDAAEAASLPAQPAAIPESAFDSNPLHKFRTFSPDSIFEQQKASQTNMKRIMEGEGAGSDAPFDWKNPEAVHTLIAQLRILPPKELLRLAIRTKLTTVPDEDTAWYHERNVLHRDSDDPHRGGTKWSMGSAAHFTFVHESRRKEFIKLAEQTLECGTEDPQITLNQQREETGQLIRQIVQGFRPGKPR